MRVVVTGATGFMGKPLVAKLLARGDTVVVLSRNAAAANAALGGGSETLEAVTANLEEPGEWTRALASVDAVIHLAGESVGEKRWDAMQKQKIRDSRVESTRMIVEAIGKLAPEDRPDTLITASGQDIYPYQLDKDNWDDDEVTEKDPPGDAFLARVCRDWEKEAFGAEKLGLRVVAMRTGLVIGKGPAMTKLMLPFKLFAGGKIGSGRQFIGWIHLDDAVNAYITALDDKRYTGPINLVTGSVRNAELAKAVGKAMHRPSLLPVPAFALKIAVGEFAEVLLNGRRVVPAKLKELGFAFTQPDLVEAIRSAR